MIFWPVNAEDVRREVACRSGQWHDALTCSRRIGIVENRLRQRVLSIFGQIVVVEINASLTHFFRSIIDERVSNGKQHNKDRYFRCFDIVDRFFDVFVPAGVDGLTRSGTS